MQQNVESARKIRDRAQTWLYGSYFVILGNYSIGIMRNKFEDLERIVPNQRQVVDDYEVQDQIDEARNKSKATKRHLS